jgi:hypothetical protein
MFGIAVMGCWVRAGPAAGHHALKPAVASTPARFARSTAMARSFAED